MYFTDHQFNFSVNDLMKLFGVTIDKDLTFKQHVSPICQQSVKRYDKVWQTDIYRNHATSL